MATTLYPKEPSPQSLRERDAVLLALRDILASHHFSSSKRYPALLQYVVENTLAGKTDLLKERTIGVEVFNRTPTYDTNADTVVRFTAGEVRKRLAAYYHEDGRGSPIRITLPSGSYIPEFAYEPEGDSNIEDEPQASSPSNRGVSQNEERSEHPTAGESEPGVSGSSLPQLTSPPNISRLRRLRRLLGAAALVFLLAFGVAAWKFWPFSAETAIDSFWRPVLRDRGTILLCAGGNVFAQGPVPGFITAGKETDYPYFSLQTATSITLLSSLIERNGATPQFDFAASTPLPDLHSHPIILLNAYNNQWTIRLAEPLRFHFSPDSMGQHSIVDRTHPDVRWERDPSIPYSNADDYALVARFWDTTTDNWVIVLAGLGRNGTEAASQFVTSSHYMQVLRDQVGSDFSNKNIEVVLKTNVIDGKTGPPSIVAVHTW